MGTNEFENKDSRRYEELEAERTQVVLQIKDGHLEVLSHDLHLSPTVGFEAGLEVAIDGIFTMISHISNSEPGLVSYPEENPDLKFLDRAPPDALGNSRSLWIRGKKRYVLPIWKDFLEDILGELLDLQTDFLGSKKIHNPPTNIYGEEAAHAINGMIKQVIGEEISVAKFDWKMQSDRRISNLDLQLERTRAKVTKLKYELTQRIEADKKRNQRTKSHDFHGRGKMAHRSAHEKRILDALGSLLELSAALRRK